MTGYQFVGRKGGYVDIPATFAIEVSRLAHRTDKD